MISLDVALWNYWVWRSRAAYLIVYQQQTSKSPFEMDLSFLIISLFAGWRVLIDVFTDYNSR